MRKFTLAVTILLLATVSAVGAQTKAAGTIACAKATVQHAIPVGDQPGHSFSISQVKCTWSKPMTIAGGQNKEGTPTQFDDITGNTSHFHGNFVDTMANGDHGFYTYSGTATLANGVVVSAEDKWTMTGGTGMLKGFKGSGTCKGKGSPDGAVTWDCEGTHTAPK